MVVTKKGLFLTEAVGAGVGLGEAGAREGSRGFRSGGRMELGREERRAESRGLRLRQELKKPRESKSKTQVQKTRLGTRKLKAKTRGQHNIPLWKVDNLAMRCSQDQGFMESEVEVA